MTQLRCTKIKSQMRKGSCARPLVTNCGSGEVGETARVDVYYVCVCPWLSRP